MATCYLMMVSHNQYRKDKVNEMEERVKEMSYEQERALIKYFTEHLNNYNVCEYTRLSSHPDDAHLFIVTGFNRNTKEYAVWTSWNTKTESLNYGHYCLTADQAKAVVAEFKH